MNAETLLKGLLYFILKAKYLKRERIKNRWKYWYKPESQRGAHEFTKKKFEQKTKLTDSTHKDAIEKILQNNGHVNLRILRDYPDLAKKYHQESRIVAADKIRAKVKASKESAQVSNPSTENKGNEEKKMNEGKKIPVKGKEKSRERFFETDGGYYVDVIDNGNNRPDIIIGIEGKRESVVPQTMAGFEIKDINLPEYKLERESLKKQNVDPDNYIGIGATIARKEAKAGIEQAIKRFQEMKSNDPYQKKLLERKRLEGLKFPSGKIEEIENSLEDDRRGFNKFMESEEDYSKLKTSQYTNADLETEYAKYPKFVEHRKLKQKAYIADEPDELNAIYAKIAELEKS